MCVCVFYTTILKLVCGFSKGVICVIQSTFGSRQNHYQANIYTICKLKMFTI